MIFIHHRIGSILAGGAIGLAMLLSSAHAALADSTTFTGQVNFQNETYLSDIHLLYNGNNGAIDGSKSLGSNYGLASVPFSYTAPYAISSGYVTALGVYTDITSGGTGIAIALNPTTANNDIGKSFDSVFGVSETTVQGYLTSNDTVSLLAFLNANQASFIHYSGDSSVQNGAILDFTNGANGGSVTLSVVSSSVVAPPVSTPPVSNTPEPASYLLMGLGTIVTMAAKFRKSLNSAR